MNNNKIKIVEPNKGKHIAVPGQINTIVASKEDTGGTYSLIECKVFPGAGPVPHIQISVLDSVCRIWLWHFS
jgi:hypothetical protein